MYDFAEQNKLIYERQFGFRARHSTNHALISTTESIKSQIDQGNYVGGVFIDLQKAFDTVNHDILCEKLAYFGFRGNCQLLIRSFLSNRQQFVSINGFDSSTLWPLLFLLYINDLRFALKDSIASHFADDTCILYANNKLKSIETVLNCDLKLASDWLNANRLSLNIDKPKLLIFKSKQRKFNKDSISIKLGVKLTPTDNVKYLGLHLDQNLSWDVQTNQLSKKLSKANGILAKFRHFAPKETLILVYYSIFYSHLQYGCLVWSLTKKENLDTITILQKKCMRIINFAPFNSHTNNMFLNNELLKFDDLIKVEQLKLIFDFKNKNLPVDLLDFFKLSSDINSHITRSASKGCMFISQIKTTNFGIKSLRYSAAVLWNNFIKCNEVNDIRNIGLFKKIPKCHFYRYIKKIRSLIALLLLLLLILYKIIMQYSGFTALV